MEKDVIVIGTRSSALAMWQAEYIKSALEAAHPDKKFLLKLVQTRGDLDHRSALAEIGTRGVFVKEIENALLSSEIDLGVHSLKDLPSDLHPGLEIPAVTSREDPRDVLVSRGRLSLADLPRGGKIGTSSPRRSAQITLLRPDLETENIRGNVDTRVRKVMDGAYDATVLAAAGLHRLGLTDKIAEYLPLSSMLPAPGQGIVAVETRADDDETRRLVQAVDDPTAHLAARAERAFVRRLGGGCTTPLGAHATVGGRTIEMRGMLATPDGRVMLREAVTGDAGAPEEAGELLAERILAAGGGEILKQIAGEGRTTTDD
ncbi:MAG TPA: hydroxymethylbilane synthase [Chloroflexota bacterium]